jgi:hypothetical protein
MKKFMFAALLAGLVAASAFAQEAPKDPAKAATPESSMKKAGFSAEEVKSVLALVEAGEKAIRTTLADSKLIEAQVTRLLIEENPDLKEVEGLLKKAADLQVKVRMIRIKLEIDIRKIVGDKKWAAYKKLSREKKAED